MPLWCPQRNQLWIYLYSLCNYLLWKPIPTISSWSPQPAFQWLPLLKPYQRFPPWLPSSRVRPQRLIHWRWRSCLAKRSTPVSRISSSNASNEDPYYPGPKWQASFGWYPTPSQHENLGPYPYPPYWDLLCSNVTSVFHSQTSSSPSQYLQHSE